MYFLLKNAIKIASTPNGNFYGKTGTGRVNGQDINGWFIGYVETSDNSYILQPISKVILMQLAKSI